jgi:hypothetical protein
VSQHDISEGLRAEGLPVEDRMVRIGQQIKRLDTYTIPVVLAGDLKTEIKLWVVSDKPLEQQEQPAAPADGAAEGAAPESEGEAKPRKKAKAEAGAEEAAAAAPEGEAKPRKKAKKAEGEMPAAE